MTISRRLATIPLLLIGLAVCAVLSNVPGTVEAQTPNQAATGELVVLVSAEGPGILAADPWRIADADGLPHIGEPDSGITGYDFSYQWIRVDGSNETEIGDGAQRYQIVDADFGKLVKARISFTDREGHDESLTSLPFGPIVRPPPLPDLSTLVGNTGQTSLASDIANISDLYAMGFVLGTHGQGYEIRSVEIDLTAEPSSLSVSLWTSGPPGGSAAGVRRAKLFEFENPASFQVGLNEFTAPAGVYLHQNLTYWIVLSDFGSTLSIRVTTSNAEDAGGEPGATLHNNAGGNNSVLRLAIKGSKRASGILAANFAQPAEGDQEIISLGDEVAWAFVLGDADRYLVRGVTFSMDDTTPNSAGFINPLWLRKDSLTGDRPFDLVVTRDVNGLPVWTAPQGATAVGGATYIFDWGDLNVKKQNNVNRIGAVLTRTLHVADAADGQADEPRPRGVSLSPHLSGGPLSGEVDNAGATTLMAIYGEALVAMVQNLGQTDNSFIPLANTSTKVVTQGFTTGAYPVGYELQGVGFDLPSSTRAPDHSAAVSVAVYTDSSGKPGTKLFDLISPTDYAAGHSFFEAPRGTVLDPNTAYVLVWRHVSGANHRLRRTTSNDEDLGGLDGLSIADAYYRGVDLANLSVDPSGNSLEIAVFGRRLSGPATGRPLVYPSADGAGLLFADTFGIDDPSGSPNVNVDDDQGVGPGFFDFSYQWFRVDGETEAETEVGADAPTYQPVDADLGHRIKVRVDFTDGDGNPESVASLPFGPIAEAGPSAYPTTLVSNTEQAVLSLSGFGLHSNNGRANGTWSDGTTIWVANDGTGSTDKVFAYTLADGERDSSKDISSGSIGDNPQSVCSDGTTMWAGVDDALFDTKLYAYKLSDLSRDSGKDITPHSSNDEPRGIWCDASTVWVIEDDVVDKIFAYKLADGTRDSSKDFNTLGAAGNNLPQGIWSDGTTMWVSDKTDNKLYAYKMSDKSRDSGKDITLDSGNTDPDGIWSDGETMLVVDNGDDKFYAYKLPGGPEPSNTGRAATITQQYAQGFRLGDHGQGYEISSVSIDLAAVPSSLAVSLWRASHPEHPGGTAQIGQVPEDKLFDFENPELFKVGLNRFTAPAGAFAYQNVNYWIVLTGFGDSLQVTETASDDEDGGGEPGAIILDDSRVRPLGSTGRWGPLDIEGLHGTPSTERAAVLRLAVEGSKRTSGILASNYAQAGGEQEMVSKGDKGGLPITLGAADRYLIRGFSWVADGTNAGNPIYAPFDLREGKGTGANLGDKLFELIPSRYGPGINTWTAPQGATVAGDGSYLAYVDLASALRPPGAVTMRFHGTASDSDDPPTAPGATLFDAVGDWVGRPLMAFLGEPLNAMVQNLGQTDNSYVSVVGTKSVLSQGFTTGSDGFGYRLQGIGVNIEGSDGRIPDDSTSVSVSVHADSGGKPGAKLFNLLSPTEFAAGHSFFEAPPGTVLEPDTGYVLVWRYVGGSWHRLQRTSVDAEDAGARSGAGIANEYYLGADLANLAVAPGGDALEIAVYTEVLDTVPGELVIVAPTASLVSSIAQTTVTGSANVLSTSQQAQPFTTGLQGAAHLDSVEVLVSSFSGDAPDVSAEIYSAVYNESGSRYDPDSSLYELTNPATLGTGAQVFTAPGGATLEPGTTYFVVFSNSASSTTFNLNITLSNDEDTGGAEGWSIGDSRRLSGWSSSSSTLLIRVNGSFTTQPTEVEPGWALVPDEVATEGGVFRLLFLSSTKSAATDTDIATYNTFVQTRAAAGHEAIQDYSSGFRAVASTAAVAARDNTATTGTSVPIYWLGGNKLADNYGDFYDGSWDDELNPTDESGTATAIDSAWTGSELDGTKGVHDTHGSTVLGGGNRAHAAYGRLDAADDYVGPLSGKTGWREIDRHLYAVSEVFTVDPNPAVITDLAITSDPGSDGMYRTGDEIEVTATFAEPVTVAGGPRIKLRLGRTEQTDRWAEKGAVDVASEVSVKNTLQTGSTSYGLTALIPKFAQGFTTGANALGYTLDRIGLRFSVIDNTGTAGDELAVTLNKNDNGAPGAVLCTLSDPLTFVGALVNTFDPAAACPHLAASTTYFVVIERVVQDAADQMSIARTSSNDEDAGSAAGWSIANNGYLFGSTNQEWTSVSASFRIIVDATAFTSVLQVPFSYTVQGEDESGHEGVSVGVAGQANAIDLNGGSIRLAGTSLAAILDFAPVPGDGGHLVNVAGPAPLDAVISRDGRRLTLVFDQELNPDSRPPASLFTVMVDGQPVVLSEGAGALVELPARSPMIPSGLAAGDQFRLLFLTSTKRDATSSDIADYNSFVQTAAAAGLPEIQPYSSGFRAVASTAAVDARDNTATTHTSSDRGVPIYWLGGTKVVDDYEDFYDGTWDDEENPTDESGEVYTDLDPLTAVWTGSGDDGTACLNGTCALGTSRPAGAGIGATSIPSGSGAGTVSPNPILRSSSISIDRSERFYAISQVFVVGGGSTDPDYLTPGSGPTVLLRLVAPLSSADQDVTVGYTDPSPADDTDVVEDVLGNDAPSFTDLPVFNRAGQRLELLPDSPLVPDGLGVGDRFRLLFLSSTIRDATSSEIEDYNLFVQAAAGAGRADIRAFGDEFYAVASTADVDARDNTRTTYTSSDKGVPVYWLGGAKAADDYADFYDGDWDDEENPTDESGGAIDAIDANGAWTGSGHDGTEAFDGSRSLALGGDATKTARFGLLNAASPNGPLDAQNGTRTNQSYLYGLSEVFTVVSPAAIETVEIVSDPGSDENYETGDQIEVAVRFGEPVDFSGSPRIKLRLGESAASERWAERESDVLVRNTGQPRFSGSALHAANPKFAQRFTSAGGDYTLNEIGVRFHTIDQPVSAGAMLRVTLNRDHNGEPGGALCELSNPALLTSNTLNTFDASGCPDLQPQTDYYVVIERTNLRSANTIALWRTAGFAEDGGGQAGWQIADAGHVYRAGSGTWSTGGAPFLIRVSGQLTAEFQDGVLISNTGQTLAAGLSPTDTAPRFSQAFLTGASRLGYRLRSIGLPMGAITDTATVGGNLRVTLNASRDRFPGDTVLCTLSHPASFSENAVNRFGASTCPALAPNTWYFVVVERFTYDVSFDMEVFTSTSSSSYDSRAAGWRLEINTWLFGPFNNGWEQTSEGVYRIEVSGRALLPAEQPEPPAPPAPLINQVANTGQTDSVGSALTSTQSKRAQAFTTGTSARGYELSNIGIRFGAIAGSGVHSDFTVSLHAGGADNPGELLCPLNERGVIHANSLVNWEQWGLCPHLEPNTTYFVVVDRHTFTASKSVELSVTSSDGEDSARTGWSIADDSRVFDGTNWSSGGGSSLAIDVRAVDIPDEDGGQSGSVGELAAGPVGKLVSNHSFDFSALLILGDEIDRAAQSFTTGPHADGYRLSSLGFALYRFGGDVETLNNGVIVSLRTGNGRNPGETLCTLGGAEFLTIGGEPMVRFYPAATNACPALETNTTYYAHIEDVPDDTGTREAAYKFNLAEDADSAPGWSIGDTQHFVTPGETQWTTAANAAWGIEVRGAELGRVPLIANTGQSADGHSSLTGSVTRAAAAFTTGDHAGGYTLGAIEVNFSEIANTAAAAAQLTVGLYADESGRSSERVCRLADPRSFRSSGLHRFTPFRCPTLEAETTYYLVVERGVFVANDTIALSTTTSRNADPGAASGWSIASAYQIAVHGTFEPPPADPELFTYTVLATDESIDAGVAVGGEGLMDEIDLNSGAITIRSSRVDAPLDFMTLPFDHRHLVNWARPSLIWAATSKDGKRVRLTFSEALDDGGTLPVSLFTLNVDGAEVAVAPQVHGRVVTLELDTPLTSAVQEVTVSYSDPSRNDNSNVIEDPVGNDARSFTERVINRVAFEPPPVEVPADWDLKPPGLPPGAAFRLLFLSSGARDATAPHIEEYDEFVQAAAAAGHAEIRAYSEGFFALASTVETDARDNTATTGSGVPVYWLDGERIAENYADLYDGSWDDEARARDESGIARFTSLADYPWTGSDHDGTVAGGGSGVGQLPASEPYPPPASPLQAEIPVDWSLKPAGLEAGDRFRLIFLTSAQRDATSTDIGVYNKFVQDLAAAGHTDIRSYAAGFRALACTSSVNAFDNTMTHGTGVPIYWLNGAKAADDYSRLLRRGLGRRGRRSATRRAGP